MRDWSQFNRMMDTVLYYMMQKRLGDQRAKDGIAYLKQSEEGQKVIADYKQQLELAFAEKENKLAESLTRAEAIIKAQQDPTLESKKVQAQLLKDVNPKAAASLMAEYEEGADKAVKALIGERKGETSEQLMGDLLRQLGLEQGNLMGKEQRGVFEYDTDLPLKKRDVATREKQAGTAATSAETARMNALRLGEEAKGGKPVVDAALKAVLVEMSALEKKKRGDFYGEFTDQEEKQLTLLEKQANILMKKAGQKNIAEYKELATAMEARGITQDTLSSNVELQAKIEAQGFQVWILLEYIGGNTEEQL